MFWKISRSLSYNALFNFIVGNRGGGKTYGAKEFCIKNFIKKGEQFIYLRRYKQELKRINTFFTDIVEAFPENELTVKGKTFYIDGKVAGYAVPLSTSKIEKSVSFPKVTTIIFDEFILDKGTYHYLNDEVINFLEFYETVARSRDVRVYFLSNALTITNPYFLYFNIKLPYNNTISCKNDVLIELVQNADFIAAKKSTRFGKIIDGTQYAAYSIDNNFLRDNKSFIEKKSGNCSYIFGFIYNGQTFGVWRSFKEGKLWVSYDYDKNYQTLYALTKADHTPNTLLINSLKTSRTFKAFIDNYKIGNVYFENQNIKNICYEVVKLAAIY